MNTDLLLKRFDEIERMMDDLSDRIMQRDGIWITGKLADKFQGQVSLEELESLCKLLTMADSVRTQLAEGGEISEDDVNRFDDKLFMLKCIAEDIAEDLAPSHPNEASNILALLENIMPVDEDELDDLGLA